MPTLQIGPKGDSMLAPHYMPNGNLLAERVDVLSANRIVITIIATGEQITVDGAFTFPGGEEWPFVEGTITSITSRDADGVLNYRFTGLSVSMETYLDYAEVQDFIGWQKEALGPNGIMRGGAGDDTFFAFAGSHHFDGNGGIDTIDYSEAHSLVLVNVSSGRAKNGFDGSTNPTNINDTFTEIEVFKGTTSTSTGAGNVFINGPGDHTFVGPTGTNSQLYIADPVRVLNFWGQTVAAPTGPVVIDFRTNTVVLNGYGGTDTFEGFVDGDGRLKSFYLGGTSTTLIAGPGNQNTIIDSVLLVLDFSQGNGGVIGSATHVLPGGVPPVVIPDEPVAFACTDSYGGTDGYKYSPGANGGLIIKPGPGHNELDLISTFIRPLAIGTIDYSAQPGGVVVDLGANSAQNAYGSSDELIGFVNATGTAFGDTLTGSDVSNLLSGGGASDLLQGLAGNDRLIGGAGPDALDGGPGFDSAEYTGSNAAVNVNLKTGAASGGHAQGDALFSIEKLIGSSFNDTLTGGNTNNVISGGNGNDTLSGAGGNDTLNGSAGDDLLTGGTGADGLNGGSGFDTASYKFSNAAVTVNLGAGTGAGGHAEGDTLGEIEKLIGSNFNDTLIGNVFANSLHGGAGDDTLSGAGGNDFLVGGAGNDTFVYADNFRFDIAGDYQAGSDRFDLTGVSGLASYADVQARMSQAGAHVVIDFGGGNILRINNTTIATLDANQGDFLV